MNNVPKTLAERPQWIVWRAISKGKTTSKIPFSPHTGRLASTSNRNDWGTLEQALFALHSGNYTGIGFVFVSGGGLFGVDLDSCYATLFDLAPWAREIVRQFASYAELSPSGRGVKIYCLGSYDGGPVVVPKGDGLGGGKRPGIELYGRNQFFAFTGRRIEDTPAELWDCSDSLKRFLAIYRPETPRPTPTPTRPATTAGERPLEERGRLYLNKVPVTACGEGTCQKRTFRAAVFLTKVLNLHPRIAFALLREWAEKGEHTFSDAELHRKISDALKSESTTR